MNLLTALTIGLFSVSSTEMVEFASGNLEYANGSYTIASSQFNAPQYDGAVTNVFEFDEYTLPENHRILAHDEWNYLLNHHVHAYVTINDVPGLLVLPDGATEMCAPAEEGITAAGALFLPEVKEAYPSNTQGYWAKDELYEDEEQAYKVTFLANGTASVSNNLKNNKAAVRLVKTTTQKQPITVQCNQDPLHPSIYYSTYYNGTTTLQLTTADATAYTAQIQDNYVEISPIVGGCIPAGVAVLIRASTPTVQLNPIDELLNSDYAANAFRGHDINTPKSSGQTVYVFSKGSDNVVGFYQFAGTDISAHKAYIQLPATTAPVRLMIREREVPTACESLHTKTAHKQLINGSIIIEKNGERYTITGQRIH